VPGNSRVRGGPWIAAGVALACLAGAGCSGATDDQGDVAASPSVAVAVPSTPGWPPITDILKAGGSALDVDDADWLQVLEDHAWTTLSTPGGGTVQQLDARSGQPEESIFNQSADTCTAMDVGFDSLWVAVCHPSSASVLRIDPSSGKVQARIPLPDLQILEEGSIASGEGSVWVVTAPPRHLLVRIDPKSNKVVARTAVPDGVAAARAGLGGLWLTDPMQGELLRLDPRTQKAVATVKAGLGARFFAVGEGAVWVQNNVDGTVSRIDPATNTVVATITVDSGRVEGGDLAVGGGFVWARVTDALVAKIDPASNTVVARYGPSGGSGSVAADDSAVWISAHDLDLVYRLPLG
jgi:virginiamycin B lyase